MLSNIPVIELRIASSIVKEVKKNKVLYLKTIALTEL
jgi:hypothetical protein